MLTTTIPLGTTAAVPAHGRHLSATAVEREGRVLLFDCGEGTQLRFLETDLTRPRVDAIFITHHHGDHLFGLPGFLSTMALLNRSDPVTVVGPAGLRALVTAMPGLAPSALPFEVRYVELPPDFTHRRVYETDDLFVEARPLEHRMPAAGYRLQEKTRPGRFDPERARALGVTHPPDFGRLQQGESVSAADGTPVTPDQVLGPPRPGIAMAYVTDTRPCDGGRALAEGADLVLHDATFTRDLQDRAHATGHSTAREAAQVARDAGAHRLLLTHISARYVSPAALVDEARTVFPETEVARELHRYELDPRQKWKEG